VHLGPVAVRAGALDRHVAGFVIASRDGDTVSFHASRQHAHVRRVKKTGHAHIEPPRPAGEWLDALRVACVSSSRRRHPVFGPRVGAPRPGAGPTAAPRLLRPNAPQMLRRYGARARAARTRRTYGRITEDSP
jgi:hypothetical protein